MFDYFDLKDALKSQFNYLTPGEAPYYFIIIGVEVFLFKAAHELTGESWFWAATVGMTLMAACLLAATFQRWDNDKNTERSHVRIARIVGIAVPLIAIAVSMTKTRHTPPLMLAAIALTFFQAFSFLFVVRERPLEKDKSINIPQLLVICSSLMFAIHFALASMSGRLYLVRLPDELVISAGERAVKVSAAASAAADYLKSGSDKQAEERKNNEAYERNKIAQSILDEEASIPLLPTNSIASEYIYGGKGVAVTKLAVNTAQRQLENLKVLVSYLFVAWAIVLSRTLFYAITKR